MDLVTQENSHTEFHGTKIGKRLNWLRAGVLGANDGIVSVSAVVVGVAGAENTLKFILTAGLATLIAGALSMAVGEYVSVSSQRDSEKALLEKERFELKNYPDQELAELALMYEKKGLSKATASVVAKELTGHDVHAAHFDIELGIDPDNLTNPWHAAYASAAAFVVGGIIPLIVIFISPEIIRVLITFLSVFFVLIGIGFLSARAGEANKTRATIRVVIGGLLAMAITFGIGRLFGVSGFN